jgi:hypothetical protein
MTTPAPNPTIRRLDVASPVPADIDIANSVEPLHIADIAAELGIPPEHYDLYGKYKAKVKIYHVLDWLPEKEHTGVSWCGHVTRPDSFLCGCLVICRCSCRF